MDYNSETGGGGAAAPSATRNNDESSFSATSALVAFLRMEADLAEHKAKRLRTQAAALAAQFGVTETVQEQYDPDQLPPLDEHGIPKYKGKKRGRKPKYRKRKPNPNRRKRQHTAYTLFVQETYPGVKAQHPNLASKDVISIVAKQWGHDVTPDEKQEWKMRALATHNEDEEIVEDDVVQGGAGDGDEDHDHDHQVHHEAQQHQQQGSATTNQSSGATATTVKYEDENDDDDTDTHDQDEDDVEEDTTAIAVAAYKDEEDEDEEIAEDDDEEEDEVEVEILDQDEDDDEPTVPARRSRRGKRTKY